MTDAKQSDTPVSQEAREAARGLAIQKLQFLVKRNEEVKGSDYESCYILPRYPSDYMMDAGLYQIGKTAENDPDDDSSWADLFSAFHDMADNAIVNGDGLKIDLTELIELLSDRSAIAAAEQRGRLAGLDEAAGIARFAWLVCALDVIMDAEAAQQLCERTEQVILSAKDRT
jgi:hypothetical protein